MSRPASNWNKDVKHS